MNEQFAEVCEAKMTEAEMVRRAQNGDAAAFEHLYKAHSARVYSVCLRILKSRTDAEDLVQQVFLRVFRRIGTFRSDASFSTWLHRVAVNTALMHLRHLKTRPAEVGDATLQDSVARDTSMLGAVERLSLLRAIGKLPAGCKKLFLLHDVMGYQHNEIAQLVGCSIGCSKSQLHKARKRLRSLLKGHAWQREADVAST